MGTGGTKSCFVLLSVLVMLLAGCATGPVYRAADKPGDYGYRSTMLTSDQFRVSFSGGYGTARETVENLALFRAAEVTIQKGADRFQVVSRETSPITETSGFGPTAGVGYGWGFPHWGAGIGYGTSISSRTRYETVLQIRIGDNVPQQGPDVYNARELRQHLAGQVAVLQR